MAPQLCVCVVPVLTVSCPASWCRRCGCRGLVTLCAYDTAASGPRSHTCGWCVRDLSAWHATLGILSRQVALPLGAAARPKWAARTHLRFLATPECLRRLSRHPIHKPHSRQLQVAIAHDHLLKVYIQIPASDDRPRYHNRSQPDPDNDRWSSPPRPPPEPEAPPLSRCLHTLRLSDSGAICDRTGQLTTKTLVLATTLCFPTLHHSPSPLERRSQRKYERPSVSFHARWHLRSRLDHVGNAQPRWTPARS